MKLGAVGSISATPGWNKLFETKKATDQFAKVFGEALSNVNKLQNEAEKMDQLFAAGLVDNIADVTIASTKADIAISYAVEITSKVLSAYNELMRLQL